MSTYDYKMIIKADENDAAYRFAEYRITEADLKKIKPIIEKINKFEPYTITRPSGFSMTFTHNWPTKKQCRVDLGEKTIPELYPDLTEADIEYFNEFVPTSPEYGIHSIISIELFPIIKSIILLEKK